MTFKEIKLLTDTLEVLGAHAGGDAGIVDTLGQEVADDFDKCLLILREEWGDDWE